MVNDFSTFLFASPSFFEGAGRILDFGNTLSQYNRSETPEEADARAFAADWNAIGDDLMLVLTEDGRVQIQTRTQTASEALQVE